MTFSRRKKIMNNKINALSLFHAMLILAGIVLGIVLISHEMSLLRIASIGLCIISLICGVYYTADGYQKASAFYYKACMIMFMLSSILLFLEEFVLNFINTSAVSIPAVLSGMIAICCYLLAFGKDTGKKTTISIGLVVFVLAVIDMLIPILSEGETNYFLVIFTLLYHLNICFFILAKYHDKEQRNINKL